MIVYHASYTVIDKPHVSFSREGLDFGRGFYVTRIKEQAEKYAKKFKIMGKHAVLNIYDLTENLPNNIRTKIFTDYDEEWLDFVMANRSGYDCVSYDVIEGGVANDKIFRTIDLYFAGDISKQDALARLKFERPNNQICLLSQFVIDEHLKFIESVNL